MIHRLTKPSSFPDQVYLHTLPNKFQRDPFMLIQPTLPKQILFIWRIHFSIISIISLAWGLSAPHGFLVSHPLFWCNTVIPLIIFIFCMISIYAIQKCKTHLFLIIVSSFLVGGFTSLFAAQYLFPETIRPRISLPALIYLFLLTSSLGKNLLNKSIWIMCAPLNLAMIIISFTVIYSQAGRDAQTTPLNSALPTMHKLKPIKQTIHQLEPHITANLKTTEFILKHRQATLSIEPLLKFISTSPDRCWTVLAPTKQSIQLSTQTYINDSFPQILRTLYNQSDKTKHILDCHSIQNNLVINAFSLIENDIYSHLNSFCDFTFTSPGKLFISFSPCPKQKIEITQSDYPIGRPARFAYLNEQGLFKVVEATSAEKGPFKTLAEAPIPVDQPFTFSLYADDNLLFIIEMNDCLQQASTQLSPCAGWGIPENAIEFSLAYQQAYIYTTLSGTSIGRGFQSVGHRSGTYRNQLKIVLVP